MELENESNKYITKDGIIKNKPVKHRTMTDPRLDAEFGRFMSFLRKYLDGFPNEKVERIFDEYINRMKNIKEFTLNHNTEWKGDEND